MARNERSSDRLSSLASKAMREPKSLTQAEIRSLGASVLTQAPDVTPAPKPRPKKRSG